MKLLILLLSCFNYAWSMANVSGWCQQGGKVVIAPSAIGGTPLVRSFMQSYPNCTITVYITGQAPTKAAVFSTNGAIPTPLANPFTASTTGYWSFYVDNGVYDIQLSGGGIPAPFTIGAQTVFDITSYFPHVVEAYQLGGASGILESQSGDAVHVAGFKATSTMPSSVLWQLPRVDAAGVWLSDGLGTLTIGIPPASGADTQVQYNKVGVTAGDSGLTWDYTNKRLSVDGLIKGTPKIQANALNTAGGYLQFKPITYPPGSCLDIYANPVNQPTSLDGPFGANDGVLWVSLSPLAGVNPPGCATPFTANLLYGLNLNMYMFAMGGFATDQTSYNSFDSLSGGMHALSFSANNYVNLGKHAGVPPLTTFDSFNPGAAYFDTGLNCLSVFNGSTWNCAGSGGGSGSPGGPVSSVQFNDTGGLFAGEAAFEWNKALKQLVVYTPTSATAGMSVVAGFMQADGGFLGSILCVKFNCIQAPYGGMEALSFSASHYIQTGFGTTIPSLTTNDTFHAGAMWYDTINSCEQLYNGTTWACIGGGGTGTPGGTNTAIQFNQAGVFGGSTNLEWNGTAVVIATATSNVAGLSITNGFVQADGGLLATSTTCLNFNCVQTPGGGFYGKSLTALNYVQTGQAPSVPALTANDVFHPGAIYWDTTSSCEKIFNGATWACLGTGGTGTPGGLTTNVQFNSAGSFGGSSNFSWDNGAQQLGITGTVIITGAPATAGLAVSSGFIQADGGFVVTASRAYNAINVVGTGLDPYSVACSTSNPCGGLAGRSLSVTNYINSGNHSGVPTLTTSDAFHAGAMYWDIVAACEEVYNGVTWGCLSGGGAGIPGGSTTNVQFNSSGSFGGSGNFTWDNTNRLLTVLGVNNTAGMAVSNGAYMQADGGFFVASSNQYNSVHTTSTGGMAGRSFTATGYVQVGTNNTIPTVTTSDAFHGGALYFDTVLGCVSRFNGTLWNCLAAENDSPTFFQTNSNIFNSVNTGALTTFQNSNANFRVNGNGDITAVGQLSLNSGGLLKIGGVTTIDASRNAFFVGSTAGAHNSTNTTSAITFQNSNSLFSVNGYGDISGNGSMNMVGTADPGNAGGAPYKVNGGDVINSSGQFVGAGGVLTGTIVSNASTGTIFASTLNTFSVGATGDLMFKGHLTGGSGTPGISGASCLLSAGSNNVRGVINPVIAGGVCSVIFTAGFWSSTPYCTLGGYNGSGALGIALLSVGSTQMSVQNLGTGTGVASYICMQ